MVGAFYYLKNDEAFVICYLNLAGTTTSRLQTLKNEEFPLTPEGTPCPSDVELDDLPDVSQRSKRLVKRQRSRKGQS